MTHASKFYEYNNITCDMRSPRNTFFAVMLDGKKITDIERDIQRNKPDAFNINILEFLGNNVYNDLFELLSQITSENKMKEITFTTIEKFSKYRTVKHNFGDFVKFADKRHNRLTEENIFKYIYGKFMFIKFQGYVKLINRETYRKLLDNKIDIERKDDNYIPSILLGGETITDNIASRFHIDDFSKINDICFKINSKHKDDDELLWTADFLVDNSKRNEKIMVPKVEFDHDKEVELYFSFRDVKTGEYIDFKKEDLDFRNYPNVLSINQADDGVIDFTANLKLEHKNELSL